MTCSPEVMLLGSGTQLKAKPQSLSPTLQLHAPSALVQGMAFMLRVLLLLLVVLAGLLLVVLDGVVGLMLVAVVGVVGVSRRALGLPPASGPMRVVRLLGLLALGLLATEDEGEVEEEEAGVGSDSDAAPGSC